MLPAMDKTMFPGIQPKGSENQLTQCSAPHEGSGIISEGDRTPQQCLAHNLLQMNGL